MLSTSPLEELEAGRKILLLYMLGAAVDIFTGEKAGRGDVMMEVLKIVLVMNRGAIEEADIT